MGFLIRRISDGRYIISLGMAVVNPDFARVFESRKQAVNFLCDYGADPDDFTIMEDETASIPVMTRQELIAGLKKERDRWDDHEEN